MYKVFYCCCVVFCCFFERLQLLICITALRRLTAKSSNVEKKLERKSVIHQYSNFDSQVYAPMTRIGVYLDSNSEQYNVKSKFTTTLDGRLYCSHNAAMYSKLYYHRFD